MPDLVYNVKFQIDSSEVERVQGKLSQATTKGTTGKSGIAKQAEDDAKSLNELLNEFKLINKEVDNQTRSLRAAAAGNNLFSQSAEESALTLSSLRERLIGVADNLEIMADSSKMSAGEQLRIKTVLGDVITTYDRAGQAIDKFSNAQEQASQTVKQSSAARLISEYSLLGKEVENTARKLVSDSKSFSVFNAATDASARSVESLSQELMKAIAPLEAVANSTESTIQEKIKARTAINQLMSTYQRTSKTLQQYAASQRMVAEASEVVQQESKRMNSSFSSSNQLLFSFSDGVQDASQFSYGFATGMRAVGNNIGFTAELFGNLNTKVKEYNTVNAAAIASGQAMAKTLGSELRGALTGAGGIILGLNLLITAVTMVSRYFEEKKKKADDANVALGELIKTGEYAKSVFSDQADEIARLNRELGVLSETSKLEKEYQRVGLELSLVQNAIDNINAKLQDQRDLESERETLLSGLLGMSQKEYDIAIRRLDEIAKEREELAGITSQREKDLQSAINARTELLQTQADLNAQSRIQANISDDTLKVLQDQVNRLNELRDIEKSRIENAKILAITEERMFEDREARIKKMIADARAMAEAELETRVRLMDLILNPPQRPIEQEPQIQRAIDTQNVLFDLEMRAATARGITRADIEKQYAEKLNRERYELLKKGITDENVLNQLRKTNEAETNAALEAMDRLRYSNAMDLAQQAAMGITSLLRASFKDNKAIAIAETLISTYFAAQKAYASQMTLTPDSPIRAQIAAAAAIASGLARVAMIRQTEVGSGASGGGGGASTASFGFTESKIEGEQTFRTPGFMPTSPMAGGMMTPKVEILADRKQLYYVVKRGEEEYRGIKS